RRPRTRAQIVWAGSSCAESSPASHGPSCGQPPTPPPHQHCTVPVLASDYFPRAVFQHSNCSSSSFFACCFLSAGMLSNRSRSFLKNASTSLLTASAHAASLHAHILSRNDASSASDGSSLAPPLPHPATSAAIVSHFVIARSYARVRAHRGSS